MLRCLEPHGPAFVALASRASSAHVQPTTLGTRRTRRPSRRLLLRCTLAIAGAVPVAAAAQALPQDEEGHLQYPRAEQLDSWEWRAGDVTVVIDRHGEHFLDGGSGTLDSVPRDSVRHVLDRALDGWDAMRFFFLVADPRTEYGFVRSLLETVYQAGVRVVAVIAGAQGEPRMRSGMDLLLRTEADTVIGSPPERPELPDSVTTIARLFASPYAIVLELPEDGSYRITGQPVSPDSIADRLDRAFDAPIPRAVFIEAAENRPFQDVVAALDAVRSIGVFTAVMWAASSERTRAVRSRSATLDSLVGSRWMYLYSNAIVDAVPQRISCPAPPYPAAMREAGIEGTVMLSFVVEPDGGVLPETVEVVQASREEFMASARAMIAGCRFRPGTVRRHPVRVLVNMPVMFTLPKSPPDSGQQPGPG